MTKTELIEQLAQQRGVKREDVAELVDQLFDQVSLALSQGDIVKISGFGRFDLSSRDSRQSVDPRNGRPVYVPQRTYVRFRPSRKLIFENADPQE